MRTPRARLGDWLYDEETGEGSTEAAREPFDSHGPIGRLRRAMGQSREQPQEQARQPTPHGPHDGSRILIAESDAYHRRVLRVLLTSPGIATIEVEDGQSAIDLMSLRSFDLILLAADLPIMTGLDVVRWVRRSQTPWADIPILGMIDDANRDQLGRMMSSGLTDWTPKPINRQHLADRLIGLMPNLAGTGL